MIGRAALACLLAQGIGLLTIRDVLTRGFDPARFGIGVLLWLTLMLAMGLFIVCPEPGKVAR